MKKIIFYLSIFKLLIDINYFISVFFSKIQIKIETKLDYKVEKQLFINITDKKIKS